MEEEKEVPYVITSMGRKLPLIKMLCDTAVNEPFEVTCKRYYMRLKNGELKKTEAERRRVMAYFNPDGTLKEKYLI